MWNLKAGLYGRPTCNALTHVSLFGSQRETVNHRHFFQTLPVCEGSATPPGCSVSFQRSYNVKFRIEQSVQRMERTEILLECVDLEPRNRDCLISGGDKCIFKHWFHTSNRNYCLESFRKVIWRANVDGERYDKSCSDVNRGARSVLEIVVVGIIPSAPKSGSLRKSSPSTKGSDPAKFAKKGRN